MGFFGGLFDIVITLSNVYTDAFCTYALYEYFSPNSPGVTTLSLVNLAILVFLTVVAFVSWLVIAFSPGAKKHRHYIRHFMYARIFYIHTILEGRAGKTDLFTDTFLLVTSGMNLILSAIKTFYIYEDMSGPFMDDYDYLWIIQIAISVISFTVCFIKLVINNHRRRQESAGLGCP
ncbi:hypothetical protein BGZ58_007379 [Dissophora ornata]|nr:hypothetical protein BGZ58_007379 [Dissophora ornata]